MTAKMLPVGEVKNPLKTNIFGLLWTKLFLRFCSSPDARENSEAPCMRKY
jgi:hypothetical protein